MVWSRVRAGDKLAFSQDLQADPTLTDLQKRMISVIATNWNNASMAAECSLTFIAAGAGTTKKVVGKYAKSLVESGRVSIVGKADYAASTRWGVNWWFRGSAWVRAGNGGNPVPDCRRESPNNAHVESPADAHRQSPSVAQGESPSVARESPKRGTNSILRSMYTGAPTGARPDGGAQVAPVKVQKENPHRALPGFAKWRVVHAEYSGEDEDTFTAHLRSGKGRKFVVRCTVDSSEYGALDATLGLDGDASLAIGQMVQMSTARSGPKEFKRAGPSAWVDVEILAAESTETGASVAVRFADDGSDGRLDLSADDATRLAEACGGEEEAIGTQVRYRLLPDETMEFRRKAAS